MLKTPQQKVIQVFLFVTLLFACAVCSNERTQLLRFKKEVQAKLDSLKTASGFPGATLAFVFDEYKQVQIATGLSDIEKNIPMKPHDRMFTGSTGKTYVAAIVMQLMDEKKLHLHDRVNIYFKDEVWFKKIPNYSEITIRMLLNHTGGIPRYVFKKDFWDKVLASPDRIWQPQELLSFIFNNPPLHPAGEGWAYSDTDYIILGMVLEKICNNSYYNELEKRILTPFSLKNTIPSNKRILEGLIPGYTGDHTEPFFLPAKVLSDGIYVINPQFEWTGGGLITNSLDLAIWAKYLYEGQVFSKNRFAEMVQAVNYRTGQPDSSGYGLGVQIFKTPYGYIYGHAGIFPGYETQMIYIPKYKCGMAIQINADQFSGKLKGNLVRFVMDFVPVIEKHFHM